MPCLGNELWRWTEGTRLEHFLPVGISAHETSRAASLCPPVGRVGDRWMPPLLQMLKASPFLGELVTMQGNEPERLPRAVTHGHQRSWITTAELWPRRQSQGWCEVAAVQDAGAKMHHCRWILQIHHFLSALGYLSVWTFLHCSGNCFSSLAAQISVTIP